MVITILSAVAQAERERILERTNDGRSAARDAGIKFGRKQHNGRRLAEEMIKKESPLKEVLNASGVSRATYYRIKKALKTTTVGSM